MSTDYQMLELGKKLSEYENELKDLENEIKNLNYILEDNEKKMIYPLIKKIKK